MEPEGRLFLVYKECGCVAMVVQAVEGRIPVAVASLIQQGERVDEFVDGSPIRYRCDFHQAFASVSA